MISQTKVSTEYPFSLSTIIRWRRDGTLTTFRQGKKKVLLSRAELEALVCKKEKVGVGSTDGERGNEEKRTQIRCKDSKSSSDNKNITFKNDEDGQKNSIPRTKNS